MSKAVESADLIMKLYGLRREPAMREARNWFISFFPESAADIVRTMIDPETSAKFRMVTSYWDMAAGFVNRGAIDEEMFMDSGGESVVVFSKIQPFIAELREQLGSPNMMRQLESLIMRQPNAVEMLTARREQMRAWMKARSEMSREG